MLKPNSITLAGSKLVADRFEAKFHYVICFEPAPNQIKVKGSHTRYRALGPELIPVYRQSARR